MTRVLMKQKDANTIEVNLNSKQMGLVKILIFRPGHNNFYLPCQCDICGVNNSDGEIRCEFGSAQEQVSGLLELTKHPYGYAGIVKVWGKGHAIVRLVWELSNEDVWRFFVPGFMYDNNEGGRCPDAMYPQLLNGHKLDRTKPWIADEWLVRADRSSHCFASAIGQKYSCAIGGKDVCLYADGTVAEKNGIGIGSCGLPRLSFSLGFSNVPFTYSVLAGQNYISRPEGFVNLDKGQAISEFNLFVLESESYHAGAARLLRANYVCCHGAIICDDDIKAAVNDIADALIKYGYSKKAQNFFVTIHEDRNKDHGSDNFSSGWAGGIQVAFPLLRAGYQFKNRQWIDCADSMISNLAQNAISSKSGMFYENYDLSKNTWNIHGWWCGAMNEIGHSGYVNGQVCYYMLKAYQLEEENGVKQQLWYDRAKSVLDHVAAVQGDRGQFGYTYRESDGTILDQDGFAGCWFVPAFATLYQISGEKRYLETAERAMTFYRRFVEAFDIYGCPHDAYKSPDQEGIIAWIKAAQILHTVTHNESYLRDLLIGLDYEFSWRFAYNVHNEVEPLRSMGWLSRGGSITSVNNSHIHPMGSVIAESILYAAENTGDEYYWSRLIDTVHWALHAYLHYDGEYGWGKKGLINERFCYTDALLTERFADGTPAATWFCGHSWASGSVLEGLTGRIFELFANGYCRDSDINTNHVDSLWKIRK